MPCAFFKPAAMMIHSMLSSNHIHGYSNGDPYVYCGDFNITPGSSMYKLLTSGNGEGYDETPLPIIRPNDSNNNNINDNDNDNNWKCVTSPLSSAYKLHSNEPNFTNYAQVRDDEPFIDCLDYIFVSGEWSVNNVLSIKHRNEVQGPLPSRDEPSDHVMIAADLEL